MTTALAFFDHVKALPSANAEGSKHWFETLAAQPAITEIIVDERVKSLLGRVFDGSPFLTKSILKYPEFFAELCRQGADASFEALKESLEHVHNLSAQELMRAMRVAKNKASLLAALSDIAGVWPLERVTQALSEFAAICIRLTVAVLLKQAEAKGDIQLKHPDNPELESGVFVLAMGKLGAEELNYSSDIDLIIFFDKEQVQYTGNSDVQHCLAKLAHEMVRMLQERTADGYVFRVDLRLRPDPASTLAAISTAGAMTYYETVGQNWERAAFIKARPIAGDIYAGHKFLKQLTPFLWRKHLDFAAIDDIQSIKRQMDVKTGGEISIAGHNVKTGIGGIREIEFFAQIHQLIWGGRIVALRTRGTCQTLEALAENDLVLPQLASALITSYRYLRNVEHYLQMTDDQQTHTMPVAEEARTKLARFMGYNNKEALERELHMHLEFVHENFAGAFRGQSSLVSDEGKLSFTGVENDPRTVETLTKMGYYNPSAVSETIQGWHRGAHRSTRTKRARELITEMTPTLLKAFAGTTDPDQAFMRFDEFLGRLPSGVQLFSLFTINPQLLYLIAIIMGSAPAMAMTLSKNPTLLDTVLTSDFYEEFPDKESLMKENSQVLQQARDFEDEIDIIRRFRNEKHFQAGVRLVTGATNAFTVGRYLSDIAETCIEAMLTCVERNIAARSPELQMGNLAVIVLGRLGARELTFGSDIDMVFVYDAESDNTSLSAHHDLYNKLSQRFISAVTVLTREGRLYEVDTRLRPSGSDGALAVSTSAFEKYFRESAWTFELMAFTRARVITGNTVLKEKIASVISEGIQRVHAQEKLVRDIRDLRAKITREFGSDNLWNIKYVHGGLIDLDFLAQYYVLRNGHAHPEVIAGSSGEVFYQLVRCGLMEEAEGNQLIAAHRFLGSLFALLRLCAVGMFDERGAPPGLKTILVSMMHLHDFEEVKAMLSATAATVKNYFEAIVNVTVEK